MLYEVITAATWSTSGSGTYSWKYIVDTSYTENGKESWTGKASFLIDPDVTAVGVEMDFSGSYTGSATYKYYTDPDEEWETAVENVITSYSIHYTKLYEWV